MERIVNIAPNQKVTVEDFENFGKFPRESLDNVVKDLGGFTAPRYSGFLVEATGLASVLVGTGRFHKGDGGIYRFDQESGQSIDFAENLPAIAQRIATIVVYGNQIDSDLEPRTKLTDAATRATIGFEHYTENRRQAYVSFLLGTENATPSPPAIPSNYVAVAHVLLSNAGVVEITALTANRVGSIKENEEAITVINNRLLEVGPQIDTLKTDISGLDAALATKANAQFVNGIAIDVARVKDKVDLPDDYATYGADLFLDEAESDVEHGDYAARVDDGVRFPSAGEATSYLELENAQEPRVIVNADMALPKFTPMVRTSVVGKDSEYPLTNTTVENCAIKKTAHSRRVRKFCGSERVYLNTWLWMSGKYDPFQRIFKRGNETWELDYGVHYRHGPGRLSLWPFAYVTVKKYVEYWITDYNVSKVISSENVAGSVTAQVILNSQDGWLTGFNLFFTKKASSGSVRVLACDTDQSGNPMLDRVLAEKLIPVEDIKVWPLKTAVDFAPTFVGKSTRYALVLMSSNAHFVAQVHNNKLAQGTIKYLVDGEWTTAAAGVDLAFEAKFAKFDAAITTVQLEPLELAGGIDSIEINADEVTPDGTRQEFEVRVNGVWRSLKEGMADTNIMSARPSLVQLRTHFIGTTDVQPALGLGDGRSLVTLVRPAATGLVHISAARIMPAPVSQVVVALRVENWDNDEHSCVVSLLTGASYTTVETADQTVSVPAPDGSGSRIITATFDVTAVEEFKIKIAGNIGASAAYYHVAERTDIEFTS